MPKSATLSSWVDTAAKWSATAASPRAAEIQARALAALAMVSWVVKVFDETMKRVRAGSSAASVSAMSAPSTLETKWARRCGRGEGRQGAGRHGRAEIGAADADIDDVGIGMAAARPAMTPSRTARAKAATFARFASTAGMTFSPSTRAASPEKLRRAMWRAARLLGIVDPFAGKKGLAPLFEPRRAGEVEQMAERRPGQAVLRIIIEQIVEAGGEMLEPFRVVGEEIDRPPGRDFDPMRFEGGESGGDVVAVHVEVQFFDFGRAGP